MIKKCTNQHSAHNPKIVRILKSIGFILILSNVQIGVADERSGISQLEDSWAAVYQCKSHILADSSIRQWVYEKDFNNAEKTQKFIRGVAEREFGKDADKMEFNAMIRAANWRKQTFDSLSFKDKMAKLDWCRKLLVIDKNLK